MTAAQDIVIIGGGVIGLATAYTLTNQGATVLLLEQRQVGGQASGAAAGIVEPIASDRTLTGLAQRGCQLFAEWSPRLLEETGIDIQFNRTGSLHLAFDDETATLHRAAARQIVTTFNEPASWLDPPALREREPALNPRARGALYLPNAFNVYSPRYVAALAAACHRHGVVIEAGTIVTGLETSGDRVTGVVTSDGRRTSAQVVIAAGAWSRSLAAQLGLELSLLPDRGQIMAVRPAVRPAGRPLRHVVHGGPGYAVPKADGLIVVGATHEEAGFDDRVTVEGLAFLSDLARLLIPSLADATLAHVWAGLRPRLTTGPTPVIGRLPGWRNAVIATGHGAWGITLSPATAELVTALLLGTATTLNAAQFAP